MDIEILSGLLFGFPEFFGVKATSQTSDWDFAPRVVPIKIAEIIKEVDPSSVHFHVIINQQQAEVWLKKEWLTSVSFRNTLRPDVLEHYRKRNKDLVLEQSLKLRLALRDENLLATFVQAIKDRSLNEQVAKTFKIEDIIKEYHS
jgi:hypothetical protein